LAVSIANVMKENKTIEIHSEEVQDIMGRIPGSLLRWGLTLIFFIFLMMIAGSYFFVFNEVVSAPMVITTSNPPAPLIAKTSGRIAKWYVSDGQTVKKGDYIALINNPAQINDVLKLEQIVDSSNFTVSAKMAEECQLPDNLVLGEMQELYNRFLKNQRGYRDYVAHQFLLKKIAFHKQEMEKHEQNHKLSLEQKVLIEKEFGLAKKRYARYQSLEDKGGVSESELDNAMSSLIQSERAYSSFLGSLQSIEIGLIGQKRALLEMQEQHRNNLVQFETDMADNIRSIKNSIKGWKASYLLVAPIDGVVTLTTFWSENHVVTAGERLATVVPEGNQTIICRAMVPSSGIGKVELGQKVNLKLTGFPYMQYGIITGFVSSVSLVPEGNSYIVELALNEGLTSTYREQLKMVQEMDGLAEIITIESRLIFRFIEPLRMMTNN
jgi:multidrug resistance efflux pump